ncbi:hypothetical protein DsansV1_C21g0167601 [Dioscorea sansibarensis]
MIDLMVGIFNLRPGALNRSVTFRSGLITMVASLYIVLVYSHSKSLHLCFFILLLLLLLQCISL